MRKDPTMYSDLNELKVRAASLANLKDYRAAIKLFREILDAASDEFETWKNLSTALLQTGEFDAAIEAAEKSIEKARTNSQYYEEAPVERIIQLALVNLVAAYGQKGEYNKAISRTKKALAQYPKNERLWNNLASFQFDKGIYQEALDSVEMALNIMSDYQIAYSLKGQILLALNQDKEAVAILAEVLEKNPYDINANGAMLGYYARKGDSVKSQKYQKQLMALLGRKEYAELERRFSKMLQSGKNKTGTGLATKAALAMGGGRFTSAVDLYERYLKACPEDTDSLVAYGHCLYELGERLKAKKVFEKVIQIDDGYAEVYQNLSRYYLDTQGESKQEAIRLASKAIELNSELDMAWTNRAAAHFQLKNFAQAHQDIKHALKLNPNNAIAWANYGMFRYQEDNSAEAINAFEEAIKHDPGLQGVLSPFLEDLR